MNLKKEFYIKGKLWRLEYKWGLRVDGVVCDGLADPNTRTITLRRELSKEEKLETFYHEFIHACLLELHLTGASNRLTEDVEEVLCSGLADILKSTFILRWKRQ